MKTILAALMFASSLSYALEPNTVNRSSFTQVNQTAVIAASYIDKVIVGVATAGGVLTIFNSTTTTASFLTVLVSSISLATVGTYDFDNTQVKGIAYRSSTATNGVTIIYKQ